MFCLCGLRVTSERITLTHRLLPVAPGSPVQAAFSDCQPHRLHESRGITITKDLNELELDTDVECGHMLCVCHGKLL